MRFQLLRYLPDSVKGEFINIGVVMLDDAGRCLAARMADDDDLRRVRCLHPAADLDLLRYWQNSFKEEVSRNPEAAGAWLRSLEEIASHSLQWSESRGFDGLDVEAAAQQIYEDFVASPPRQAGLVRAGTGPWVKRETERMFRASRLLERLDQGVAVERFTFPNDPFRIHYAYANGATHYIHALSLFHSVQQSKVLAFTFERMRQAEKSGPRLTAVVESEPPADPRVDFTRRLFDAGGIEVLPLDRIQGLVRRIRQDLGIQ